MTGPAGMFSSSLFIAFLLGSIVQFTTEAIGRYRNVRRGGPRYDIGDAASLSIYAEQLAIDDPRILTAAKLEYGITDLTESQFKDEVVKSVSAEIPRIARRMRGGENELYDEYDRLVGEAQLREIALIPIFALIVALASMWSWFSLVALAILPPLKRQAVYQREAAHEVVVDAVIVGKVAAPSIERLQRRAERLPQAGGAQ